MEMGMKQATPGVKTNASYSSAVLKNADRRWILGQRPINLVLREPNVQTGGKRNAEY